MMRNFGKIGRFAVIVMVALWGAVGVIAPAHAAEEDIHHATQHHDIDGVNSADDVEDEGVVHPEHATHCHAGACHIHMMGRGATAPASIILTLSRFSLPVSDAAKQTDPLGLFHPPRI